jgi:hypothetical protein
MTVIGETAGTGYTSNNSTGSATVTTGSISNSIISGDSMAFAADYGNKGMIKGHGRCSKQRGSRGSIVDGTYPDITTYADLTDETGQTGAYYCWVRLDSYTPVNGSAIALSGSWVFRDDQGSPSICASKCAEYSAQNLNASSYSSDLAFRAAMFDSVESSPAMCEANTITINWSDASAADISANNAGTATYGSDVRTPVKAQTIKGKTFKGWRFSKPETTNLPE